MPEYSYVARQSDSGVRVQGKLTASTQQAAIFEIENKSLVPIYIKEVKRGMTLTRPVTSAELSQVYIQLADLLHSGVPLLKSLEVLCSARKKKPLLRSVLQDVKQGVSDGQSLASSMKEYPKFFNSMQVSMIMSGEQGGFLEEVLRRIGIMIKRQEDLKNSVLEAMIYPTVLLSAVFLIIIYALVFFVPQFETYFQTIEIPVSTKLLLGVSSLIRTYWYFIILSVVILFLVIRKLLKYSWVKNFIIDFERKVPFWGALRTSILVAQFTRTFGTLLSNSIPVLDALKISSDTIRHPVLKKILIEAQESVRDGSGLVVVLEESNMISDNLIEMMRIGEESNNLSRVLKDICEILEQQVNRKLSIAVRLLEPLMLVLMGLVVIFIFFSLLGPMLEIANTI